MESQDAVDAAVKDDRYRFPDRSVFLRKAVMRLLRRLEKERMDGLGGEKAK